MSRRTLLGVWAHPDDEAYTSAGLMAELPPTRRSRRGRHRHPRRARHRATPTTWPPGRLAALRDTPSCATASPPSTSTSCTCSASQDGDCEQSDGPDVIARHITDIDPDVIVTFGPDGMTGHPDHRAVSRWTTDAWAATRPDADLWYATVTPDFHRRWGAVNDGSGCGPISPNRPAPTRRALPLITLPTTCSTSRSPRSERTTRRPLRSSTSSGRRRTASGGAPSRSAAPYRTPNRPATTRSWKTPDDDSSPHHRTGRHDRPTYPDADA